MTGADFEQGPDAHAGRGPVPRVVRFSNGRTAQVVDAPVDMRASEILAALGFESSRPVIAIVGGAAKLDERIKPRLSQLFSRAVARVAADRGAVMVDGGTDAGLMALIGQGVADRGHRSDLLGIAPAERVTYPGGPAADAHADAAPLEPNHTHVVLIRDTDSGGEVRTLDAVAQALAGDKPAVSILAGGGPGAVEEVVRSVRRHWPIVVLAGSGQFADQLITYQKKKKPDVADPRLAEILADGRLQIFSATGSVDDLARVLNRVLDPPEPDPALDSAWRMFALLDANANADRSRFEFLQKWIIRLGVLATFLALVQSQLALGLPSELIALLPQWATSSPLVPVVPRVLYWALLVVTVITTMLLAAVARFKAGSRWVLLRGGAEAVKREIYWYRAKVDPYTDSPRPGGVPRSQELANRVNAVANQVFTTEISELALRPYEGVIPPPMYGAAADDNGFGALSTSRYMAIRVGDQIAYYRARATQLDRQLRRATSVSFLLGGVATLLAAAGLQLWVPMTAALIAAIATVLEYQQVATTLAKYNQAIAKLLGVQAWWEALPESDKDCVETREKAVVSTEGILEAELSGWVRQMHDALDRLRTDQQRGSSQDGDQH